MQVMVVEADRPRGRARWTAERRQPRWLRPLAGAVPALMAVAGGFAALHFVQVVSGSPTHATAFTLLGLAGASAAAALGAYASLGNRLDILSSALDVPADAQLIVAPDGRSVYANTAFKDRFPGRDEETVLDRIGRMVAGPECTAEFCRLCNCAAAGACGSAEVSLYAHGEAADRVMISVNPITGHPGFNLWSVRNITGYLKTETGFQDQQSRFANLLDSAAIGFYSVDGAGRFHIVNQTLADWLDIVPAEIITSEARLHALLASPAPQGTPPFDPFGDPGENAQRGEVLLKTRQGATFPAWIGQNVVGSGANLRTCSVVCDLTRERDWRAALRLARRFQQFFANAPVGTALLDSNGRFEDANRALGELFGAAPEDLIGRELIGLLNEEDRGGIAAKLAAVAEGRAEREAVEVRIKHPRERTTVLFLSRIGDADGGNGGLTLHFIDITEQKNLEIQFAQSQKMQAIGQLAGGVAHDFNNLLTAMIGFCDLLLLRSPPGDPSFADIMQIKQNANRAANLVRQLLAFSRQQTLQPRILNITEILVELSHLLRRLIGENIELNVVHRRDLGLTKVDQGQLEQVIINLAVNARDAMPSGGTLTIRTENVRYAHAVRHGHELMPAGDYVLIAVADTGIGIARDHLERIFDPFFSTKELGSGTGLGLSTVYGIVKQTGGFIFVDSAPGRGAVFEIYLPRHDPVGPMSVIRSDIADFGASKDLTGIGTVMLVEDEDPVRLFGARALRSKGYKVIEAKSGEAALEVICRATEKIDLLITDVVMPRMDGPGLVRKVREIYPNIKVIFISGYAENAFRQRLDSDGDIDFLSKPFDLKELATKVKDVIGKPI